MPQVECSYCCREIDSRGIMSHIHFKHKKQVVIKFSLNPWIIAYMWAYEGFLPPNLSKMALPSPKHDSIYGVHNEMLTGKAPRWV